jgi:hypothetical protein
MGRVWNVACVREKTNSCKVLAGKPEGKKTIWRIV